MVNHLLRGPKFQTDADKMMDSEWQVACFLDSLKIEWTFESPIYIEDEKGRPRVWTPDFYLHKLDLYIEVCGSRDFNYEYRDKIYQDNNVSVIFLHYYKKQKYWQKYLIRRIKEVVENRYSVAMKVIENLPAETV